MSKTLDEMEQDLGVMLDPEEGHPDAASRRSDPVNHPKHYTTGGIETLDVIRAKMSHDRFEGYLMGNVLKYLLRCEYKDKRIEDIKKAQFYLNALVKEMETNASI